MSCHTVTVLPATGRVGANCVSRTHHPLFGAGLYKGILPNALKIVPNNGIRFLAYETLKDIFGAEARKR